jgi:2-iminoacetate synthase
MKFNSQSYSIPDRPMEPFLDPAEIKEILKRTLPAANQVREVIRKSLDEQRLSMQDTAILLNTTDPGLIEEIKEGARTLKKKIYGDRIVLFAPLYVGNHCRNDCRYCGFRASNQEAVRKTLSRQEIIRNVKALEQNGQKRLILAYGEHRKYSPEYIAETVRTVYSVRQGNGEIRRVNINAAPFDIEGFMTIKEAGIGTYQVFQESYHPETYASYHPRGKKADYIYRLTALDRAQEAGMDDVGIGALFGLYDWRFEVLGLIRHTNHLEACYQVGPHTISFPRIQDASANEVPSTYLVSDEDFARMVAIRRRSPG